MVVRGETRPGHGTGAAAVAQPSVFRAAVESMTQARLRAELSCQEMPAPQRIAPWSSALSADLAVDGDDVATGRIILLHDPAGNDAWQGTFRCVAYVRSEVELELVSDPMLGAVGWSWLTEALDAHRAEDAAPSGTVTRGATQSVGGMAEDPGTAQVEIRASWTPLDAPALAAHVEAWGELLCVAAGLPPVPEGVTPMPSRRTPRGSGR